jgi:hypothetical protein
MPSINVLDATGATVSVNTPNADGQLTMANSRSVAIASDQSPVPIFEKDGLVIAVTPQSALGNLFSVDAIDYRTAVIQLLGTFVGTVTFEVSNDNVTFTPAIAFQPGNTGSTAPATTATAVGIYIIPVTARYVRARVSTYTSGTFTGSAILRTEPARALGVNVVGSVSLTGTLPAIVGQAAHDAVLAGNPVRLAGRAITANYTAVATGDTADLITTLVGAQVIKPYTIPELEWAFTAALTLTTDVAVQTAAGAGLKRHVTLIQATNTGASAVDLLVRDGTTTRLQITIPAGQSVVMPLATGIPLTANTALNVQLSVAGTVRVNMLGYTAP